MLKNQNIICISSIDWDFVWQGHQEIMSTFARNGNRVLFIENTGVRVPDLKDIQRLKKRIINWFKSVKGFRKQEDNLYLYSPLILPFPYSRFARWINKHILARAINNWMKAIEFHDPIIWTFLPTGTALDIINNIDHKFLVYYCIANFYELVDNAIKVKRTEDELLNKCDLIFAQGKALEEKCRRLNNNVHVFPFGVNMGAFDNFLHSRKETPFDMQDIKGPVIGYIGGIHKHIDFGLLKFIAHAHPEWSIVLVGPIQTTTVEISGLKNIYLLGKKDFSQLPYYINRFDVCLIPYLKSGYTSTVYPTKLNEYHALGKPVVSTDLPEVVNFNKDNDNLIFVAKTHREFAEIVRDVIRGQETILVERRIGSAKKNSWIKRIEEMSHLIEEGMERKSGMPWDWRDNFLKIYKQARRKTIRIVCGLLISYLLIFYTPLFWFLASPLKISQIPKKADAIVVFAGGVGESGKVGQGFEERVQHAVELYRQGYAQEMVFSSGYIYVFEEPIVMKALVVSLGVKPDAIILEERATNTYENVAFTKRILEAKGWHNIILISSPYHMLRAKMVFKKIAPDIKVIYSPVPNSRFYSRGVDSQGRKVWRQINLQQIRGIIHEYLGILYYWWKGYIS